MQPLAERLRPQTLDEYIGQKHLVGPGAVLRNMIDTGRISSFILWGPPGVGKTTLAQIIANKLETPFYTLSAVTSGVKDVRDVIDKAKSNRFFSQASPILFIDEIHKYKDWSKELKLMYDYYSELRVVFSGSSVLDLDKGSSDLSRRAVMYHLYGLSFREYLRLMQGVDVPVFSLDEIVQGRVEDVSLKTPLLFFEQYLRQGYYPFAREGSFEERLRQIINLTLETDIPMFAEMSATMGRKFKKLLSIIAQSVPFKPNMSKLAELIGTGRNLMGDYLRYIEDAGMIIQLKDDTGGIRSLGKVEKIYLDNSNLIYALADGEVNTGNLRETFFVNQMRVRNTVTSSALADFEIGSRTFEIGGRSKGKRQIEAAAEGYVVKDDIEFSSGNILPLWWFGLNY